VSMGILRRRAGWWAAAAALPAAAVAVVMASTGQWHRALDLPAFVRFQVDSGALLVQAAFVVIAAPLAGVAAAAAHAGRPGSPVRELPGRSLRATLQTIALGATIAAVSSVILSGFVMGRLTVPTLLFESRAALWASAVALGSVGALLGATLADPLDAGACALGLAVPVAAGVLVLGPVMENAPTALVNMALVASPIVAVAAAANIDVLRSDVMYQISPLAHTRFDYPAWGTTCGWHLAAGLVCFAVLALTLYRTGRIPSAERAIL
ncbi:MAG: hypothetical protein ABUS56_06685, partial [Acidobacteriota bacterium]